MTKKELYCCWCCFCDSLLNENAPTGNRGIIGMLWSDHNGENKNVLIIITIHKKTRNDFMECYV